MGVLASAGLEAYEVLAISEDMFNLMSAGSIDANTSASILTNTMSQFGIGVDKSEYIVDTFAATASGAKIGVDELEYAMGQAGTTFAGMNMSVDESTAALGHLANAGVPVGQIGTMANAMGREIKASAGDFKEMGIEVYDSEGKLKDMGTVMGELEVALDGKSDAERDAALSTVFSGQAMQGATAWMNKGSEAYDGLVDSVTSYDHAAEVMAGVQEDTIGGAFRALGSVAEGVMIQVGDVIKGPIQDLAIWASDIATKFTELDQPAQEFIVKAAGIAAAIGPILFLGGKIFSGISSIPARVETLKTGFSLVKGAMNPVTLGIAAVVGAGILLYKNWDTITQWAGHLKNEVTVKVAIMKNKVGEAWEGIQATGEVVTGAVSAAWEGVTGVFDSVKEKVSSAAESIQEKWQGLKDFMSAPITGTVSLVQKGASAIRDRMPFKTGAYNIPYDNFPADLHKGEMVLTSEASDKYRAMGGTENTVPNNTVVNTTNSNTSGGNFAPTLNITVNNPEDSRETVNIMKREWEKLMQQYQKRNNLRFGDA